MEKKSSGLAVTFVDRERRAIYLEYEGCSIALAFAKERNDRIRSELKDILIGSVINQSESSHDGKCVRGVRKCS